MCKKDCSIINGEGVIFGSECEEFAIHRINRTCEWYNGIEIKRKVEETINPFNDDKNIVYSEPEKKLFENISQDDFYSPGLIKSNHWDSAVWKGVMYLGDLNNKNFIKIGFLFQQEGGAKRVFQDLINVATTDDKFGKIIISFIFAIFSTIFMVVGPKISGKAITELSTGFIAKVRGSGAINFDRISEILLFLIGLYLISTFCNFVQGWMMASLR